MTIRFADLLRWLVPDPQHCRDEAKKLAAEHPGKSPEELARHVVTEARRWAAATGAATGAVANPLIMIPAALADIGTVLRFEGLMAGTIAALLDPAALDDPATFQTDMLSVVFPGAISQALRQFGIRAGQQLTKSLIRRYITEGLLEWVGEIAAKRMFLHLGERAIVSKTVPLVGAGIGAGWNWIELQVVGNRALRYYNHEPIAEPLTQRFGVRRLLKLLPWPSTGRPKLPLEPA